MLFGILRVRSHKNVTRMRVAVNKARDEDLLGESFDDVSDYCFLVKSVLFELLVVSYLDSIDPL